MMPRPAQETLCTSRHTQSGKFLKKNNPFSKVPKVKVRPPKDRSVSEASSVASPGEGPGLVYCLGKRNPHIFKELMGLKLVIPINRSACMNILTAGGIH